MTQRSKRISKLRLESLESKRMLAGDVAVSVVAGSLVIDGDDLDNQIAITSGQEPGSYIVRGLEGTTVTLVGSDAAGGSEVAVTGVRRDVRVALGAGNDVVQVGDATFRESLRIATGEGDDTVVIGGPRPNETLPDAEEALVRVGGGLHIETGAGADTVTVASASVRGHLGIGAGEGDDTVRLGRRLEEPTPESLADTPAESSIDTAALRVGGGVGVRLGDGTDGLAAAGVASPSFRVHGGAGDDSIRLQSLSTGGLAIGGGGEEGADEVLLDRVHARNAQVHTGDGADAVRIIDSVFAQLAVSLGAGDDTLAVGGSSARIALLGGGDGDADAFRDLGENEFRRKQMRGFELPTESPDEEPTVV